MPRRRIRTSMIIVGITLLFFLLYNNLIVVLKPKQQHNEVIHIRGPVFHRGQGFKNVKKGQSGEVKFMTIMPQGRLGNAMFQYASLTGIARQNKRIPVLPNDSYLRDIFKITAKPFSTKGLKTWRKVPEVRSGYYDKRTQQINITADMLEITGYRQSWKYFECFQDIVHTEFTFVDEIISEANSFLMAEVNRTFGHGIILKDVVFVGVHVRRGDLLSERNKKLGYNVASAGYLTRAMDYISRNHESKLNLLFIICTDDHEWVAEILHVGTHHISFCPDLSSASDLAILSLCDHNIITVGTFGWWGAYLAGGQTIYFKDFALPNTTIYEETNPVDYFLPNWIGLS